MANTFFRFKQFTVHQQHSAMKVTTDGCLFGAWVADALQHQGAGKRLLDIGTGTGLLSLMVAQKNNATIDAVEIDNNAAAEARENFAASPWKDRLHLHETAIQDFTIDAKYDHIFCNPPFYENELKPEHDGRHLAHHSKSLLLKEVVAALQKFLSDKGSFFLLLPAKRSSEAERLLNEQNFYLHEKLWVRQTEKHAPFRLVLRGGRTQADATEREMIISENGNYTQAFAALLRDYYLAL
ncbi:MAG: tRNA1(Val) (adenine(37)-N6)-methyltransferase [Flavisolibacter sp.]